MLADGGGPGAAGADAGGGTGGACAAAGGPGSSTVRLRGMETGIPEASKSLSFYFFLCYPGRQASGFPFSRVELGPSPRGSDPVPCRLT